MSYIPVAKRTRSRYEHHLQLLVQESKRRKRNPVPNISSVDECDEHRNQPNGSEFPSRSPKKSNNVDESSHERGSKVPSISMVKVEESCNHVEISSDESKDEEMNKKDNIYESDPETSYVDSSESDESDSDYVVAKEVDQEKGSKGASRSATRVETVDTSSSDEFEEEKDHKNGSRVPSTSTQAEKSYDFDEFSLDESKDEGSSEEVSPLLFECDGIEVIDMTRKSKGYGSASSPKTKTQVNLVDLSDDSDSNDSVKGSKGACRLTRRKFEMEKTCENGSGGPSKSMLNLTKSINIDESSVIELSNDEESSGEESRLSMQKTHGLEGIGNVKSASADYGSATPIKTGTHTYFYYPSDDSDSDDKENIPDKPEDENVQKSCKDHESPRNPKAGSIQSTEDDEDESSTSSESEKSHLSLKVADGSEEIDIVKSAGADYGSASPTKAATHTYFDYRSDDPDTNNIHEAPEDENVEKSFQDLHESLSNLKAGSFPSTENEPFSSTESESDKVDDVVFSPLNKKPNQVSCKKQSPIIKTNLGNGSDDRKEKNHSGLKRRMKRKDTKMNDEPSDVNATEETNPKVKVWDDRKEKNHPSHKAHKKKKDKKTKHEPSVVEDNDKKNSNDEVGDGSDESEEKNHKTDMENMDKKSTEESKVEDCEEIVDKENVNKNQEPKKGGQNDDDDGCLNDMLDSIIGKEEVQEKVGDDCIPLKFRFDESEDEAASQESNDFGAKGLFEEMDFALDCEEIISYKTPTVKNQGKGVNNDNDNNGHTNTTQAKLCQNGDHCDIYFEEQTGMRCRLCGTVILESRYVIPKLANSTAANRSKRSYHSDEHHLGGYENMYFNDSDSNHLDVSKQSKGTVWELIPQSLRAHLYPHQEEGFEFLWNNLAGTTDLSKLHKLGSRGAGGGGGCIISHAPGTGKTLLTIVFMESFLKRFPKCCPVIVAPASMLLTWEAEFRKWQVCFSFLNLNTMDKSHSTRNNDLIRAMKIKSWSNGGSVLGVSYNLYGKLAGDTKIKNPIFRKMGNVLLDMPGLIILDEGHTPRNQNSNIWNTFLKLKTSNRVILSGTPFQNNFRELFNTLGLVRPATAMDEKYFADMINKKKSAGASTSEVIDKLKMIIKPFVHVHEGHILESSLPGLKQTIALLYPSSFQKSFIENLGISTNAFEYDYKVALVSVHPSLIVHCQLSEKEEMSIDKQELKNVRLRPELGVKTRFVMELLRLSTSLNEKVLIFSQYSYPLQLLKDQIAETFDWEDGREIEMIRGRTLQKFRQRVINDFNDPTGKVKVLLASTKCCSEGIHLTGASRVVLLDVVWNPSVERQAISRAYRLGQKNVVYTYHLMTAGTTEEVKYDRQVEKGRLAKMVFSSAGEEANNKMNVDGIELDDKVLEQMLEHQELNDMFKKITFVENETRS